jgi:alpha-L-rhamnosidase
VPPAEAHALFRRTFRLDQRPARVPARITADSRYLLTCNRREVFRGPIRSQPRRLFYDLFDLAPYLRAGRNVIAIYVKFYGTAKAFWQPAPAGFGGIHGPQVVFEANLGSEWLVTDAGWKAHQSTAWEEDWRVGADPSFMEEIIPVEVFDARKFPYGWEKPGFDDSAWGDAHVMAGFRMTNPAGTQPPSAPYGPLHPRPIAKLGGDRIVATAARLQMLDGQVDTAVGDPVRRLEASLDLGAEGDPQTPRLPVTVQLTPGTSARITVDMGRIVMGQVQFAVEAPPGAILDFSFTEEPLSPPRGGFLNAHPGSRTRYTTRGANDRFSVYDALGFRYANILLHGVAGWVTLTGFAVQEELYPWQPGAEFRCSDEDLNEIFCAGIRTVNLNARDAFTDCPTREQQAWVGDSVVHQMVTLVTNTDWRLAWQYLTLSDSPRYDGILPMTVVGGSEAIGENTIPDWSLHWVHGVYNLYRFTGDREKVLQHMPSVMRVLRWFAPFQNRQGVLENVIEWALIDWSAVSVDGQSAIYTAIWARGLREFAEMAGWLGEQASREWAEALYAKAKEGFEMFWDEARGSYVDHIVNGEKRPEMSQLAGALGIVSGLAPKERRQRIVRTITDQSRVVIRTWVQAEGDEVTSVDPISGRGYTWDVHREIVRAEPFMSYVVHDAIAEAEMADQLTIHYRDWGRFLRDGYDTIGEDWKHGNHVHGWSCTPTKDMVFYTLGATPAEPGYTVARIAPHLGGLAWAEGKIPTPHGLIWVRAEPGRVELDSPVPVLVELPDQVPQRLAAGRHRVP